MKELIYAGIGYIAGAFTPAVGREIKSWFVKEAADAKKEASTEVKKL
jgi:hypothetical protein